MGVPVNNLRYSNSKKNPPTSKTARVVEILGAPGVGKTSLTILLSRCRKKSIGLKIVSSQEALKRPRGRYFCWILDATGLGKLAVHFPNLSRLFFRPPTFGEGADAVKSVAADWAAFLEFCLTPDLNDGRSPVSRLYGMYFLVQTLQIRALLETSRVKADVVLMDEPLSYRLSLFSRKSQDDERKRKYYELMPLPNAVIHLHTSLEVILKRLTSREKIATRHRALDKEGITLDTEWALGVAEKAATILESRGVPVLRLNAGSSLQSNGRQAIRFFQELIDD